MARELSPLWRAFKNQLANEAPFVWLYELSLPPGFGEPFQQLRFAGYTKQVPFGVDDSGEPLIWYPAPITHGGVRETSEGDLPQLSVTVGHTGHDLLSIVDRRGGLMGYSSRVLLVNLEEASDADAGLEWRSEVVGCSINMEAVTLQLAAANLTRAQFPRHLYSRLRCRNIFGDEGCGYDRGAPGAGFQSCKGTLTQCIERGEEEATRGIVGLHPRRFLGFPGMQRRA